MKRFLAVQVLALSAIAASTCVMPGASAQTPAQVLVDAPSLIPQPTQMKLGSGAFSLTRNTPIFADYAAASVAARNFAGQMAPALGFTPVVSAKRNRALPTIVFALDTNAKTGDEGYRLAVTPQSVTVT